MKINFKWITVLIVFAIIAASILIMQRNVSDPDPEELQAVLDRFYTAIYITSDYETMEDCLLEEYRYYFQQAMTMADTDTDFYKSYREDAVRELGETFAVSVEALEIESVSLKQVESLKQNFSGLTDVAYVTYTIVFENDTKRYEKENDLYMAQVESRWFMSTHLTLPVGTNTYAY